MLSRLKAAIVALLLATALVPQAPQPAHAFFGLCFWWCPPSAASLIDERPNLKKRPQSDKDFIIKLIDKTREKGGSEDEVKGMLDAMDRAYKELGSRFGGDLIFVRGDESSFQMATRVCKPVPLIRRPICIGVATIAGAAGAGALVETLLNSDNRECAVPPEIGGEGEEDAEAGTAVDQESRIEKNAADGRRREDVMLGILKAQYKCDNIYRERYLRDANGKIAKDPRPAPIGRGEGRRLDFVVVNVKGVVIDAIEVTGPNVSKTAQQAKETAIFDAGGVFVRKPKTKTGHATNVTCLPHPKRIRTTCVPARVEEIP